MMTLLSYTNYLNESKLNKILSKPDFIEDFEGSKVVDALGKPILMYHGGSYSDGEFSGWGWFTVNKADAKYYAKQSDGNLTEAYLIIKNPLYTGHIKHLNIPITDDILKSAKKRNILNSIVVKNGVIQFIEANNGILVALDTSKDGIIDLHEGNILDAVIFESGQILNKEKYL
jgi:hypothetical protein